MKKYFTLLTLALCLCTTQAWGTNFWTQASVSAVYTDGQTPTSGTGGVYVKLNVSSDDVNSNIPTDIATYGVSSYTTSNTEVKVSFWPSSHDYSCCAYAYPPEGYRFVKWVINNTSTERTDRYCQVNYTITSTSSSSPDIMSLTAYFEPISIGANYSSSKVPSVGNFILFNVGTDRYLNSTTPSSPSLTADVNSASVFYLTGASTSTLRIGATTSYLGQKKGGANDFASDWDFTLNGSYYFLSCNYDKDGKKGKEYLRYLHADGVGVNTINFPRDNQWTNSCRSWAFIPVFFFHTTAPTVVGGTQTWSVANAKKIPLSSDYFDEQSTTATFAATPSTNYHFAGWWDNSSYTGAAVLNDASYTNRTVTNSNCADTLRYYAKFVPYFNFSGVASYDVEGCGVAVSYSPSGTSIEGGVCIDGTTPDQASQNCTITFTATTDDDHNFAGWYDNASFTGDYISMSSSIDTTVTNSSAGSTTIVTLYPKFVTEKVPVFTWYYSSVVVGTNNNPGVYSGVFTSTNEDNAISIESDDETIAKVIDGMLYAYKEGTVDFTVTQDAGNGWIEHSEVFTVYVNPAPDWGWISEEPADGGNFYIRVKGSSARYLNNNNAVGDLSTLWTLTTSNGTWSIKDATNASKFVEVLCISKQGIFSLSNFRAYSDGASNPQDGDKFTRTTLSITGSTDKGYSIYAQDINYGDGWFGGSQTKDIYVELNDDNSLAPKENGNPWEFISKAQYDAQVAYSEAASFAAVTDNHLSNSLRSVLNTVMEANSDESSNYTSKAFSDCKSNLDEAVETCATFVESLQDPVDFHRDESNNGYYMFYDAENDTRLGDDVQAYTASWSGSTLSLTAVPNQVIPAGTVALVYSNTKTSFYYAFETAAASAIAANAFVYHDATYQSEGANGDHVDYILSAIRNKDNSSIIDYYAFLKYTGDDSAHDALFTDNNKKVLVWKSTPAAAPSMIRIVTSENTPTALVPVYGDQPDNSEIGNGQIYTILGLPVSDMSRPGIYIQNGKKYVVR